MPFVMVLIELSTWEPSPHDGRFLKEYDPSRSGVDSDGVPWVHLTSTADKAEAMQFSDLLEATECWKQVDPLVPVRPDGRPNRPLTLYSVGFEKA